MYINKYSNLRCVSIKKPVYSHIQKQEILGKENLDLMNATAPMVNFILLFPFFPHYVENKVIFHLHEIISYCPPQSTTKQTFHTMLVFNKKYKVCF